MKLKLRDDLVYVKIDITCQEQRVSIPEVVVDTGSATTLLSADFLAQVGVVPLPDDVLYRIRGVGGAEIVFSRDVTLQI